VIYGFNLQYKIDLIDYYDQSFDIANMNSEHVKLTIKLMTGKLIQLDITPKCTGICLKTKLLEKYETIFGSNSAMFDLSTDNFRLFYDHDEKEDEIANDDRLDLSNTVCVFVEMGKIDQFYAKYGSYADPTITLDLTNFDVNDAVICLQEADYIVHLNSSNVFNAIMNDRVITRDGEVVGTFEIHIHPSSTDPVTKADLRALYYSLPPNRNRSKISYIADKGVFTDSIYTTEDFLKEL
jgi:hypothetical protein